MSRNTGVQSNDGALDVGWHGNGLDDVDLDPIGLWLRLVLFQLVASFESL